MNLASLNVFFRNVQAQLTQFDPKYLTKELEGILERRIENVDNEYDKLNITYIRMLFHLYTPYNSCDDHAQCTCLADRFVRKYRHHFALCATKKPLSQDIMYKQNFYPKTKPPLHLRRLYKCIPFKDDKVHNV